MGIHKLMSLIQEKAPGAIKQIHLDQLTGRIIACDASMAIYQFIIATQTMKQGYGIGELKDEAGNLTGHLVGMFHRTIQFLENGVKPLWVFDGKAPLLKLEELSKRKQAKLKAEETKKEAIEEGNMEEALKMAGRSVKVTEQMISDAKKLVRLMGAPLIEAAGEAEAQCAALCKAGKAFGTASEDMDSLTFGTPILLRGFNSKKEPITQIELSKVLEGFNMTMEEFIDLCIMCGCDYSPNIEGVGPIKAFRYITDNKNIEAVLEEIKKYNSDPKKKKKLEVPANFRYQDCREIFKNPDVVDAGDIEFKWNPPVEEELKDFLINQKGFNIKNVESGIFKLKKTQGRANQVRLDSFFKVTSTDSSAKKRVDPAGDKSKTLTGKKSKPGPAKGGKVSK